MKLADAQARLDAARLPGFGQRLPIAGDLGEPTPEYGKALVAAHAAWQEYLKACEAGG